MKNLKQSIQEKLNVEQIEESVQYQPKKRMDKNKCYDFWEKAYELLGGEGKFEDNQMLQEIFNYLDDNACTWIIENLDTDHELGLFSDEEE